MKRLIISSMLAVALLLVPVAGALAATSQDVSITAQPGYISISNTPADWVINDVAGDTGKYIAVDTIYYSNPLGDTTIPSDPIVDAECRFTITNNSGIATNIVVNFPDHANGDASTNSNLGTNNTTSFGAYAYTSYGSLNYSSTGKVIAKATLSDALISSLPATTEFLWGLAYESQSDDWGSGTAMTSTVVITATGA